jgi:hypothetical protein
MKHITKSLAMFLLLLGVAATLSCDCLCSSAATPAALPVPATPPPPKAGETWHFAVSGDSRNCGDVVMPTIAQGVAHDRAHFYWHLGDLRAIYDFDEDMLKNASLANKHLTIKDYEDTAWQDFNRNQTVPFGGIPFFLGIGNHETISPQTRAKFLTEFNDFLDMPQLRQQRSEDKHKGNPRNPQPATYYHWVMDGIDFIYLDNASKTDPPEFDPDQLSWFHWVITQDTSDSSIRTVVVGMHAALPYSISAGHSMNEWTEGISSGTQVYQELLKLQNEAHKKVYALASHSHFFMEDIFNTQYWRSNGGVLPGWIVGTGGAVRYALPEPNSAKAAKTNVYGYLLATVNPANQPPGTITFEFKQVDEKDVPPAIVHGYTQEFVHWCFANNSQAQAAGAPSEH